MEYPGLDGKLSLIVTMEPTKYRIAGFGSSGGFFNHANNGIRAMAIGKSRRRIKIDPIFAIAAAGADKPLLIPAAIVA
jgi:hypothetical protein